MKKIEEVKIIPENIEIIKEIRFVNKIDYTIFENVLPLIAVKENIEPEIEEEIRPIFNIMVRNKIIEPETSLLHTAEEEVPIIKEIKQHIMTKEEKNKILRSKLAVKFFIDSKKYNTFKEYEDCGGDIAEKMAGACIPKKYWRITRMVEGW